MHENQVWPTMRSARGSSKGQKSRTFLAGGGASSPFAGGGVCSSSFSVAVRFLPRAADFGFSFSAPSPSSTVLGFLERGLAGAFLGRGSGLA